MLKAQPNACTPRAVSDTSSSNTPGDGAPSLSPVERSVVRTVSCCRRRCRPHSTTALVSAALTTSLPRAEPRPALWINRPAEAAASSMSAALFQTQSSIARFFGPPAGRRVGMRACKRHRPGGASCRAAPAIATWATSESVVQQPSREAPLSPRWRRSAAYVPFSDRHDSSSCRRRQRRVSTLLAGASRSRRNSACQRGARDITAADTLVARRSTRC